MSSVHQRRYREERLGVPLCGAHAIEETRYVFVVAGGGKAGWVKAM